MNTENWKLETIAVQAGYEPENGGPRVQPIVQSTTYKYLSARVDRPMLCDDMVFRDEYFAV